MTSTSSSSIPIPEDGSALCLSCGLCCLGILHGKAILGEDEVEQAARLGLSTFRSSEGKLFFQLPCPCYKDNRCSVYPDRPRVCSNYRCKLLDDYLRGRISWKESQTWVKRAWKSLEQVRRESSLACNGETGQLTAGEEVLRPANGPALLALAVLKAILHKHFLPKKSRPTADG